MDDTASYYLVSYGVHGHLGLFVSSIPFERGTRVRVKSERGIESGSVLCPTTNRVLPVEIDHNPGEILGILENNQVTPSEEQDELAVARYLEARQLIKSLFLPIQVVDMELLAEPATVVMHVLQFSPCDFSMLQKQLCQRWQAQVLIHDITNPEAISEAAESGCGSCGSGGGCGSGSCGEGGCSTGSCGSNSDPQTFQKEWQSYFSELRQRHMSGQA